MKQIKVNDRVKYSDPFPDELGIEYIVLEITGDRALIEADVPMPIKSTYKAHLKDLLPVISEQEQLRILGFE